LAYTCLAGAFTTSGAVRIISWYRDTPDPSWHQVCIIDSHPSRRCARVSSSEVTIDSPNVNIAAVAVRARLPSSISNPIRDTPSRVGTAIIRNPAKSPGRSIRCSNDPGANTAPRYTPRPVSLSRTAPNPGPRYAVKPRPPGRGNGINANTNDTTTAAIRYPHCGNRFTPTTNTPTADAKNNRSNPPNRPIKPALCNGGYLNNSDRAPDSLTDPHRRPQRNRA